MNILIIHKYFLSKGEPGISRFNQLVKYWSSFGYKITVIAGTMHHMTGDSGRQRYKRKFLTKEIIDSNVTVFRTYVSAEYNKNFFRRFLSYATFLFSSTIVGLFWSGKQDLVIATSPPLSVGITGYIISLFKRIPLVFEVRDLWPDFAIDAKILRNKLLIKIFLSLEKFIYKKAKLINVLTPAFEKVLIEKKKVPKEKIIYIPNGADLDLMSPGPRENAASLKYGWQDKFVILYVGAHGLANNLDLIIDGANLLKDYKDFLFVLIGDGMLKQDLIKRANNLNLNNVLFLDSVSKEEIVHYINASDICVAVLKKIYDTTYPNKVFDYMSCAKPIVVSIDGTVAKLVEEESKSGLHSKAEDVSDFKEAIMKMYKDKNLRDIYGKNGYAYVKDNFSREVLAKKYENELKKLVIK